MEPRLQDILDHCLAPLAGDNPAGDNPRGDPLYDQVRTEINKLTALSAGESGVDWEVVSQGCQKLLGEKGKDLNLAAYLCLALLHLEGYEGLSLGLEVLKGLIDGMWEQCFPPLRRSRARANLFQWLEERLGEAVGAREPAQEEAAALHRCAQLSKELAELVQEKMEIAVTGLSGLRQALAVWQDKLPAPEPPAPEEPPQAEVGAEEEPGAAGAAAAPAPEAAAAAAAVPSLDAEADGEQALEVIRQAIDLLRAQDPASCLAYRLARVLKWEQVQEAPASEGGGQTLIPSPREEELAALDAMQKAGQWASLAEEAESRFLEPGGTFLLDLQRMVAQALHNMGAEEAAQAVAEETLRFMRRLPELPGMSFDDGRPFADAQTQDWLREIADAAPVAPAAAGGGGAGGGQAPAWQGRALELATQGELQKALELAQQARAGAAGAAEACRVDLAAAELCLKGGQPSWAVPILEGLAAKLEKMRVEDWDASFCARLWQNLLAAYQQSWEGRELDEEDVARLNRARRRLFHLDLAAAARLAADTGQ